MTQLERARNKEHGALRPGVNESGGTETAGKPFPDLPDFIIAGAMKCATNTLHDTLRSHPDIFMPKGRIVFYDIDDPQLHADFFGAYRSGKKFQDYESNFDELLPWYRNIFAEAGGGKLLGEASPAYLPSPRAASRMAALVPGVKLIFLLRDPVARAYSHYWHDVASGRAMFSFERSIQYDMGKYLERSCYKRQLEEYYRVFPRHQIHVIMFEQFISDFQNVVRQVLDFLDVDQTKEFQPPERHENRTPIRRFHRLHLMRNWMLRDYVSKRYHDVVPGMKGGRSQPISWRVINNIHHRINPITGKKAPKIAPQTAQQLSEIFACENAGLAELIGIPVEEYWPSARIAN